MKKIVIFTIIILVICALGHLVIKWLFSSQYNSTGISHYLVITIDKNSPKEYVGELEGHKVCKENKSIK